MGLVDRSLATVFHKLGFIVARYPKYFIISTIIVALTLGTGLLRAKYEDDVVRLYSNTNGRSVYEKRQFLKYFPQNHTNAFSPSRLIEIGRLARVIVTPKDGKTLFTTNIWKEIAELNEIIHKTEITYSGQTFNYSNLCGKPTEDTCYENNILEIGDVIEQIENGTVRLSFPFFINPVTYTSHLLAVSFAGLVMSSDNFTLVSAVALNINYFLHPGTPDDDLRGKLWEKTVMNTLLAASSKWKYIIVDQMSHFSVVNEQEENTNRIMPFFTISIFLMCCFTVASALSTDWVKAKPWVAMSGILAATLGTLAAFGFLGHIGIPFIGINLSVPFIMLGIGIDDTFVMLSAWRQTNLMDSVPKRLADTYAEAAVSITITSLTDMLSFYVGLLTPIPSVQIFCGFAGTCVFWIYIFQIFFFGAILGISGDQEAGNRHSVFWWIKATPKSKADGKSTLYKLFFTGGIDKSDPLNHVDNDENAFMIFFRDYYARFIAKKWVGVLVLTGFVVYLVVSIWGLLYLEEGLKEERLYRDDSFMGDYYRKDFKYFKKYQFRMQVGIFTPLNYSEPKTQERVKEILDSLRNSSRFISPNFDENWLTGFTSHVRRYSDLYDYNITTEAQFISTLKDEYLPGNIWSGDVVFNEDGTQIIASRFIIQFVDTITSENCKEAVIKVRKAAAAHHDVEVVIYNSWLGFVDQYILIRPLTIQLLSIASVIVMVVAIIFIPNLVTSICVFFTIASTELGVLGFMSLWGVSLDMVSILCLIMCIGFSVDFSAHVSYAYISTEGSPEERIQKAMYSLGLPILQGGMSTVIGVFSLVFIPSYICQVFFKVVFLVIVIAGLHGLFLLPVVLLLINPESIGNKICRRQKFIVKQSMPTSKIHSETIRASVII